MLPFVCVCMCAKKFPPFAMSGFPEPGNGNDRNLDLQAFTSSTFKAIKVAEEKYNVMLYKGLHRHHW